MKRISAGLLAATAAGAALATGALSPVLSGAHPTPAKQTVTFQEPNPQVAEDDIPPRSKSTLSLGDRLAIDGALENANHKRLGTFGGSCTVVGSGKSFFTTPLLCHAVYAVAGGQIETMGLMTIAKTNLVILGGSGSYTGVHGLVTPGRHAKGFSDADKLTIER